MTTPTNKTYLSSSSSATLHGTGLLASHSIAPASLILHIPNPTVTVPDDAHLAETCSRCMMWKPEGGGGEPTVIQSLYDGGGEGLAVCKGCRVVRYCGKTCQSQDWQAFHKHECKIYSNLHPRILPASIRCTIRFLHLLSPPAASSSKKKRTPTQDLEAWRGMHSLEDHLDDLMKDIDRSLKIKLMAQGAEIYSETKLEKELVFGVYCKVLTNTITHTTPTFDPIGLCLDVPYASKINHSCNPNSVMVFDNRALHLRSLRAIAKDEEITISYVDNTFATEHRKQELREKWFFECGCEKCCFSGKEGEGARTDEYVCAVKECGGTVTPPPGYKEKEAGEEAKEELTCHPHSHHQPHSLTTLLTLESSAISAIFPPSPIPPPPIPVSIPTSAKIQTLTTSLTALYKTNQYPPHHQPLPTLHQTLSTHYISNSSWKEALLHYLVLYLYCDPILYPQRFHPVRVCHGFVLAMLVLQLAGVSPEVLMEIGGAEWDVGVVVEALLEEVAMNVGGSHGAGTRFAQMVERKKGEVEEDLRRQGVAKVKGVVVGREVEKVKGVVEGFLKSLRET